MDTDAKGRKQYEAASDNLVAWLSKRSMSKAKSASKNLALVKIGYLLRLASELKRAQSIQWIKDFHDSEPKRKLIVFTMHKATVKAVKDAFPHCSLVVDGSVNQEARKSAVKQFQHPKSGKWLFIGQVNAAGVGLTLTVASTVAFLDLPWNPAQVTQAEDRIHRIGQTETCLIYYHVLARSIEKKIAKMIRTKATAFDQAIDGKFEQSAFEELTKL
jgi:SWI/SNF-related matrix-associated actin-dependent regulator 1 of chromatin subfamily A